MAFLAAIPAAIGSVVGGAGGFGTLLSVAGTVVGAMGQAAAARQQAKIADANAKIAYENAQRATSASQEQVQDSDREMAAFIGAQEAAQSASGLSTSSRSSVLTRKSAQRIGRIDSSRITEQGRSTARNFLQQQQDYQMQAKSARSSARFAMLGGMLGAATSLVGGASPTSSYTASSMRNPTYTTRGGLNATRRTV
jgi:hypothetical protein